MLVVGELQFGIGTSGIGMFPDGFQGAVPKVDFLTDGRKAGRSDGGKFKPEFAFTTDGQIPFDG